MEERNHLIISLVSNKQCSSCVIFFNLIFWLDHLLLVNYCIMLAIKICFGFKEDMKLLKERRVFQIQFSGISILNYFDQMWEKKIGLSGELIPFSGSHCRGPQCLSSFLELVEFQNSLGDYLISPFSVLLMHI